MRMIILYVLLIAYILAVNFYAFILVKSLRDRDRQAEEKQRVKEMVAANGTTSSDSESATKPNDKTIGKLCITGLLGGAITIYVCMFLLKYKRTDLLLMVVMPLLGVLNVYLWVLLFRSGLPFFVMR